MNPMLNQSALYSFTIYPSQILPREPVLMAHLRATGSLPSIDLSLPKDHDQALETANEWLQKRNIPRVLLQAWSSFDVEIDFSNPVEAAKFRKESAIRRQCLEVSSR